MSWRKVKPFVCPLCSKDFKKESMLKRHMADSHGKELNEYRKLEIDVNETKDCGSVFRG